MIYQISVYTIRKIRRKNNLDERVVAKNGYH